MSDSKPSEGDQLRNDVATAIMDAHCRDDWTGHTLADAALRIVAVRMCTMRSEIARWRRAADPRPWMREIDRLSDAMQRLRGERLVAAMFGSREPTCPKPFALFRHEDVTGASGTGLVATGVQFDDGTTVLRWRGETPSTVVWPSVEAAQNIHGHDGRTQIVWLNEDIVELSEAIERDERAKVASHLAALAKPTEVPSNE